MADSFKFIRYAKARIGRSREPIASTQELAGYLISTFATTPLMTWSFISVSYCMHSGQ